MEKISILLFCLFSTHLLAFSSISGNEDKIELFKMIDGKYENSRKAEADVILSFEESDPNQPSLFGPEYYELAIDFDTDNFYFSLDEDNFQGVESDGSLVFSEYDDDCDNPGCTNFEAYFTFRKKKDGSFYLVVKAYYTTDAEDLSWELSEDETFLNASETEQEAYADKRCQEYYGPSASLNYLYSGYDSYQVYCDYENTTYLKKVN